MIHTFLKAKHWQLFLALCGPPFLFVFYTLYDTIILFSNETVPFDEDLSIFFKIFPILMMLFTATFFGWFWSMAIGLQQCISSDIKMKVTKFKVFFFIPLIYILFLLLHISGMITELPKGFEWIYALITPLHLFSMSSIFYMLYFVSKTIKTAELQREVRFSEFLSEFFLLWFYIIGIWIIQPKVNRLYAKMHTTANKLK